MKVVLATANPDKVKEILSIVDGLDLDLDLVPRPPGIPDVVEDAPDLIGNARLKAVAICEATGMPALADDTGLEVDALEGAPGVHSARFAGEHASYADNRQKLMAELEGVYPALRTARFRTVALCRFPDGTELHSEGTCEGIIGAEPRGTGGFGYDPLFVPVEADGRTLAELSDDEKHSISGRGKAFRAMAKMLAER